MSHSFAGRIPNRDRLYADPVGTLSQEEIRIAPARKRARFVAVAVLALLAPLLIRYKMGLALSLPTYVAIMATIIVVGFPLIALCPFGVEWVLTAEGIRLRRRATEVFCPWSLFHAPGNFFVGDYELVLPIAPRAIPFIRQYHHECLVRQGVQIQTALLTLQNGTQAALLNQSTAPSDELGRLLLHLGRTLGGQLPAESALAEACPAPDGWEPMSRTGQTRGWVTVNLTRLVFPPFCCDCGLAADTSLTLDAGLRLLWVVACLGHYNEKVRVAIPICHRCLEAMRRRQRRGRWAGAATGLLLGLLATFAMVTFRANADRLGWWLIGGVISLVGIWVGFDTGWALARCPVRACYSPRNHTLALRFRRSDYADAVRALGQNGGRGCNAHPATFAPVDSHRSGGGGNDIAEAFDGKDR